MASSEQLAQAARHALEDWHGRKTPITPSVNVAVFDRSGVIAHRGWGEFQRDGRRPQLDTIYRIASMSKSFLVAAVLLLEERGLVDTHAPVSRYVPEFRNYVDAFGVSVPVTVQHLMSNSSGLPEDNAWGDSQLGMSRAELARLISEGLRFAAIPGTLYQYSNLGFAVLGMIVERVTGRLLPEVVEAELLAPVGLRHTHYDYADFPGEGEPGAGIAYGFTSFDRGTTWVRRPFGRAGALGCVGSMYSILPDIARWCGWLSRAFSPDDGDDAVLSRAARRRMQIGHTAIHDDDRVERPTLADAGYGLGLVVEIDRELGRLVQHSGGLPGFSSNMRWHPDSGIGVVVFTNTNGMPTREWTYEILADTMRAADVPAQRIPLWPETTSAARSIDAVLCAGGSLRECAEVFTDNVFSDIPLDQRDNAIRALIAHQGGLVSAPDAGDLASRVLWAPSAAGVCWRVPCRGGDLHVRIELTEVHHPRVQRVVVELPPAAEHAGGSEGGTSALVTHQFQPVITLL